MDCSKSKKGKSNNTQNSFVNLMTFPFQRNNIYSNCFLIEPFSCKCSFVFDQRDKSRRRNTSVEIYNYIKIRMKINENNNLMSIYIYILIFVIIIR